MAAAVFAAVVQESGSNKGLVKAKARLAKQGLTIPRQELVSAYMAVNLVMSVCEALEGFPVTEKHSWLDSTVALHCAKGHGEHKQFESNRVRYNHIVRCYGINWGRLKTQLISAILVEILLIKPCGGTGLNGCLTESSGR